MAKIMKYKTFIRLLAATGVLSLGGLGWLILAPGEEAAVQKSAVSKAAAAPTATAAETRPAPLTTEALREKLERWLEANPDDDFAPEVRATLTTAPKRHVTWTREFLGWGVFALMPR